jgi:hypothetical protein
MHSMRGRTAGGAAALAALQQQLALPADSIAAGLLRSRISAESGAGAAGAAGGRSRSRSAQRGRSGSLASMGQQSRTTGGGSHARLLDAAQEGDWDRVPPPEDHASGFLLPAAPPPLPPGGPSSSQQPAAGGVGRLVLSSPVRRGAVVLSEAEVLEHGQQQQQQQHRAQQSLPQGKGLPYATASRASYHVAKAVTAVDAAQQGQGQGSSSGPGGFTSGWSPPGFQVPIARRASVSGEGGGGHAAADSLLLPLHADTTSRFMFLPPGQPEVLMAQAAASASDATSSSSAAAAGAHSSGLSGSTGSLRINARVFGLSAAPAAAPQISPQRQPANSRRHAASAAATGTPSWQAPGGAHTEPHRGDSYNAGGQPVRQAVAAPGRARHSAVTGVVHWDRTTGTVPVDSVAESAAVGVGGRTLRMGDLR